MVTTRNRDAQTYLNKDTVGTSGQPAPVDEITSNLGNPEVASNFSPSWKYVKKRPEKKISTDVKKKTDIGIVESQDSVYLLNNETIDKPMSTKQLNKLKIKRIDKQWKIKDYEDTEEIKGSRIVITKRYTDSQSSDCIPDSLENKNKKPKLQEEINISEFITKENNICCPDCPKLFKSLQAMKAHHKLIHHKVLDSSVIESFPKIPKSLKCPGCLSMFNQEKYLKQHLKFKHPELSSNNDTTMDSNMSTIMNLPLTCQLCLMVFDNSAKLYKHLKISYNLEDIPTNTSNLNCDICSREFSCGRSPKHHLWKSQKFFLQADNHIYPFCKYLSMY